MGLYLGPFSGPKIENLVKMKKQTRVAKNIKSDLLFFYINVYGAL